MWTRDIFNFFLYNIFKKFVNVYKVKAGKIFKNILNQKASAKTEL